MKSHATAADKIRPSQVMKDGGLWLRVGGGELVGSWDKTPPSDDLAHSN